MPRGPKLELSAAEYRKIALGAMTEREWRRTVKELAAHHGWHVLLEVPDRAYQVIAEAARTDRSLLETMRVLRGWPDLLIGSEHHGCAFALELKTAKGKVMEHQVEKINLLNGCGINADVWRPDELDILEARLVNGVWE